MHRGPSGHYLPISTVGETAKAFVPAPLPPTPPLEIDGELGALLDAASTALGRLDGISLHLPEVGHFRMSGHPFHSFGGIALSPGFQDVIEQWFCSSLEIGSWSHSSSTSSGARLAQVWIIVPIAS